MAAEDGGAQVKRYRPIERFLEMQSDGTWKRRDPVVWGLWDEIMGGFCALPTRHKVPRLIPLEWETEEEALQWLNRCLDKWEEWEISRKGDKVPQHWRGFRVPERSPWEGYTTPIPLNERGYPTT